MLYTYFPGNPVLSGSLKPEKLKLLIEGCSTWELKWLKFSALSSDWNGVGEPDDSWVSRTLGPEISCTENWTLFNCTEGIEYFGCDGIFKVRMSLGSSVTSIAGLLSLSFLCEDTITFCRMLSLLFSFPRLIFHLRGSITVFPLAWLELTA